MMTTSLNAALRETVKMTIRHLESVPDSAEKRALHDCCVAHLTTIDAWSSKRPDSTERADVIHAVLSTHKSVVELTRRQPH